MSCGGEPLSCGGEPLIRLHPSSSVPPSLHRIFESRLFGVIFVCVRSSSERAARDVYFLCPINALTLQFMQVIDVSHPDAANVSKEKIKEQLAKQFKVKDDKCIFVFGFKTAFGGQRSTGFALVYKTLEDALDAEPKYRLVRSGLAPARTGSRKQRKEAKNKRNKVRMSIVRATSDEFGLCCFVLSVLRALDSSHVLVMYILTTVSCGIRATTLISSHSPSLIFHSAASWHCQGQGKEEAQVGRRRVKERQQRDAAAAQLFADAGGRCRHCSDLFVSSFFFSSSLRMK